MSSFPLHLLPSSFAQLMEIGEPVEQEHSQNPQPSTPQQKRRIQKRNRLQEGIDELKLWVHDLLLQGLKRMINQPHTQCEVIIRRLHDAQARGLSVWIQKWALRLTQNRPLDQKMAYLIYEISALLATLQWDQITYSDTRFRLCFRQEIDQALGSTLTKKEILASTDCLKVYSTWQVFALLCTPENGGFTVQCWLRSTPPFCRFTVLHFFSLTRPKAHQYTHYQLGKKLDLHLAFYPSLWPLRAFQVDDLPHPESTLIESPIQSSAGDSQESSLQSSASYTQTHFNYGRIFKSEFKAVLNHPFFEKSAARSVWSWPTDLPTFQHAVEHVFTQKLYTPWRAWIPFQCKDVYLSSLNTSPYNSISLNSILNSPIPTSSSSYPLLLLIDQKGKGSLTVDLHSLPSTWSKDLTLQCPIASCLALWNGVEVRLCVLSFQDGYTWINDHQDFSFEHNSSI